METMILEKTIIKSRTTCRLCNSVKLELAIPMNPSPIGDDFVTKDKLSIHQESYPLSLYLCKDCGHLQLPTVVDPSILFKNYIYETSTSPGLVEHFRKYADEVIKRTESLDKNLILEIGSNDGTLLRFFKNYAKKVLGVDPATNIAKRATESGVETIPEFFNVSLAQKIKQKYGSASIIAANNVFAHADNMLEIVEGIQHVLSEDGIFVFEVSYLVDILQKKLFDTIYHEHLCYHSIEPLEKCFNQFGMRIFDVKRIGSKGGSIRCFVQQITCKRKVASIVEELIKLEQQMQLNKIERFKSFSKQIQSDKENLLNLLNKFKGKQIVGYGASPTVITLIHHFELAPFINCIVDDNPIKQGRFSPGHHIPVYPSQMLYDQKPDFILILAWQYAKPIMEKHKKLIDQGVQFIFPLPEAKIVSA